jgi:outer membrane protein OmpA-like peptidoglycan-associated protein
MALGLLASGCSMFGGEEEQAAQAPTQPSTGDDQSFPNLGSVPDQPPPSTSKVEREKLVQGLLADRAHAEYSTERLGEETANVAPAPPPPAPPAPQGEGDASAPAGQDDTEAAEEDAADKPAEELPPEIATLPGELGQPTALIYFEDKTSSLADHDRAVLADVARAYKSERSARVRVIGHASATEAAASESGIAGGFALALTRADAVAQALIALGVPPMALETSAGPATYDESEPNGVAANRRVEVYIGP